MKSIGIATLVLSIAAAALLSQASGAIAATAAPAVSAVTAATPTPAPAPVHHTGTLIGISGGTLTVQTTAGQINLVTDASTIVTVKGVAATPASLKIGMTLSTYDLSGTATKIAATVPVVAVTGSITAVNGAQITVQQKKGPITFTTDANTVVTVDAKASTAGNLQVGMTLTASTGLGVATKITAKIPKVAVAGIITVVNGAQITVQEKTAVVTFTTDASTVVKLAGKVSAAANLKAGMKVKATTGLGVAETISATIPVVAISGSITAVNGAQITIQEKTAVVTFSTDANTVVKLTGKAATVADLKVGMKVTGDMELGVATKISATIPKIAVAGMVTAVNGANITVQEKTALVTFTTDADTVVKVAGKVSTVAGLEVGMKVKGTTELGVATTISATIPVVAVTGTILNINGAQITVQGKTAQVTFTTDADTVVKVNGKIATLADLTIGMTLTASTDLGVAASISAKP